MRQHLNFIMIALLTCIAIASHAQDSWSTGANLPAPVRASSIGFAIGDKGYAGLGGESTTTFYNDIWEYNTTTNTWTAKDNFPGNGRIGVSVFVIGNKAYVGMGQGANDLWEFDPSKSTGQQWTQKANYPGTQTYALTAMTIGSYGYAGIGDDANRQWWRYDPANNQWVQKASYPYLYYIYYPGFGIGNRGYVIDEGDGTAGATPFIAEYNPDTDTWTPKTTFTQKRTGAVTFVIGGKGYFGAGSSPNAPDTYFNTFFEYDPVEDVVRSKASIPGVARAASYAFAVNGKGYTGAGYEFFNGYFNDLRIYTPDAINCSVPVRTKCTGEAMTVNYNVNNIVLNAGNTITVELSNSSGSFASPVTIGTLTTTSASGQINTTIPAGTTPGNGYRVRVKSSNTAATSSANGSNITINSTVTPTISIAASPGASVLLGTDVTITANVTNGGANPQFAWTHNGSAFGANKSTLEYADYVSGDVIKCTLTSNVVCTTSNTALSNTITMTINPDRPGDAWVKKTDFAGGGRINASTFTIGGKAYVGLGSSFSDTKNDMWEYDPGNDTWTQKANSPQQMTWATNWVLNDKAYVTTGFYGVPLNSTYAFDPIANTWASKAIFPGTKRYLQFYFTANGKGYVGGGYDNNAGAYLKDLWEYNPVNDSWTPKANAPTPRSQSFSFSANNKGYVGGGGSGVNPDTHALIVLRDIVEYDPANDTWTQKSNYPGDNIYYGVATSVDGKGYIQTNNGSNAFLEYDPLSDSWATKALSPVSLTGSSMFSIGSRAYVVGGQVGAGAAAEVWQYTTDMMSISAIPTSCPGDVQTVKWSAGKFTTFNGGNTFTVQLSDANGSFGSPTAIGTATSSAATGTIQVTFPTNITEGNYKMRLVSGSPSNTSGAGATIPLHARPNTSVTIASQIGNVVYSYQTPYIDATVTNGGFPAYQWKKNGENIVGAIGSQYGAYQPTDGDSYTVVVTANLACALPVESNAIVFTVVSGQQKIETAEITNACQGQALNVGYTSSGIIFDSNSVLQAQLSDASGSFDNPINIGTLNSPAITGNIPSTIPADITGGSGYRVRVIPTTPFSNWFSGAAKISETNAHIEISTNSVEVCSGALVSFVATSGEAAADYQWMVNGLDVGTSDATYSATDLADGDVVTCVMTPTSGCTAPGDVTSNELTITVKASVELSVSTELDGSLTGCSGDEVTITANVVNGGSNPGYQWLQGPTVLGTTQSVTIAPEAGVIFCLVTASDVCTTAPVASSEPLFADPKEKPAIPKITVSGNGGALKVQDTDPQYTYNWYRDGEKLNVTLPELPLGQEGLYNVQVGIVNSTCVSDLSADFNVIFTGDLDDHNATASYFPNPTEDRITIQTPGVGRKHIYVYQMDGRLTTALSTSRESEDIDVRTYSPGVYLLRITKPDGVVIGKFLKK